jgi:hypothetical protein
MHVLAARFRTISAASAALRAIRSAVTVAPGDSGVRPLGSTRYDAPTGDFLLAGRFEEQDVPAVIDIVATQGGKVIEQRSEPATTGPPITSPDGPHEWTASNPPWSASWTAPRHANRASREGEPGPARARKLVRRPSAPLRVRTARAHRFR